MSLGKLLPNKIFDAIMRIENTLSHIPHHNTQDETENPLPITIKRNPMTQPRTEHKQSA
jgi:hypothetical protein